MNLTFTPTAWGDYQWFQQRDRKLLRFVFLAKDDFDRLLQEKE